jgi:hypothetical protein
MKIDPSSEIARNEPSIREAAEKCGNLQELAKTFGWNMEVARHANEGFNLGLPERTLRPAVAPRVGVACPKLGKAKPGGK